MYGAALEVVGSELGSARSAFERAVLTNITHRENLKETDAAEDAFSGSSVELQRMPPLRSRPFAP